MQSCAHVQADYIVLELTTQHAKRKAIYLQPKQLFVRHVASILGRYQVTKQRFFLIYKIAVHTQVHLFAATFTTTR